jgi:hypothetical protein
MAETSTRTRTRTSTIEERLRATRNEPRRGRGFLSLGPPESFSFFDRTRTRTRPRTRNFSLPAKGSICEGPQSNKLALMGLKPWAESHSPFGATRVLDFCYPSQKELVITTRERHCRNFRFRLKVPGDALTVVRYYPKRRAVRALFPKITSAEQLRIIKLL